MSNVEFQLGSPQLLASHLTILFLIVKEQNCQFSIDNCPPSVDSGAEGVRTPDLVVANHALSQLSYSPVASVFKCDYSDLGRDATWCRAFVAQPKVCGPE